MNPEGRMPVDKDRTEHRAPLRYTLEELVAGMTPDNQHEEQFPGPPVGAERIEWEGPIPG